MRKNYKYLNNEASNKSEIVLDSTQIYSRGNLANSALHSSGFLKDLQSREVKEGVRP